MVTCAELGLPQNSSIPIISQYSIVLQLKYSEDKCVDSQAREQATLQLCILVR